MITIYDSGKGGVYLYGELKKRYPEVACDLYLDTSFFPYGEKSREFLLSRALLVAKDIEKRGALTLVVACNTVASWAIPLLEMELSIPVVDPILPSAELAVCRSPTQKIAVFATPSTVESGSYVRAIKELSPHAEVVQVACPHLATVIERGVVQEKDLVPLVASIQDCDTLVLGCTHYSYARDLLQKIVPHMTIIDSNLALLEYLVPKAREVETVSRR